MSLGLLAPRVCALGRWQGGQESLGLTHSPQKNALAAVSGICSLQSPAWGQQNPGGLCPALCGHPAPCKASRPHVLQTVSCKPAFPPH